MTTALEKIEKQALEEIKDYSTRKKYFVSDFQERVRKKNIKAKKRLIGTGNEGALSGLGEKKTHRLDKEYDLSALKKGTKIEMEHETGITNKKRAHNAAEKTAKDHLDEDPKYYDKLEKIEESIKEYIKLEEGILQWLGLAKPDKEIEPYLDYSQPDTANQLYIGSFPSIVRGEMEDAKKKFDKIYNMSIDAKQIMTRNSPKEYGELTEGDNPFIIDTYAIEDLDLDETTDANRIEQENTMLTTAANIVARDVKAGQRVLVVCSEGRNRSVATSIVALRTLGMNPQEAYQAIKAARAKTMDEVELIKAAKENRRAKKINKPVMQIGDKPHARFMRFAGITPEKIQEMVEKFLAKILR
jgi:hypothetical protein